MGSWVLSLRTLNGKTNLTLASLKFTKKCNNNNNNSENYEDCRVQRHSVTVFSYMGAVKKNNWNSHACWNTTREKAAPEMPTSEDLKSGDCLFLHYPPPPQKKKNWPSPQWEWLRTLYGVLHDVRTIKIRNHRFDARNNLCQWLNTCKNAQKPYCE